MITWSSIHTMIISIKIKIPIILGLHFKYVFEKKMHKDFIDSFNR